jgi:hypothetical protein
MAVALVKSKPVGGRWPAAVIGIGAATGIAGLVERQGVAPARALCQLNAQVVSFNRSLGGNAGSPSLPTKAVSCASFDLRYDLGLAAALLGLAIVVVGFGWLTRRSRRSARAGAPWPLRRKMDAAALWIDARLPGRGGGSQPRLRGGFLTALSALLIVAAVVGGDALWNSYQRSEQIQTYETATTALAAVRLPTGLHKEAPTTCEDTVCARSDLWPAQVAPTLRKLIDGAPMSLIPDEPCPAANRCPVTLIGHYDGALTIAIAFWRLVQIRHGEPPKGAIRIHPRVRVTRADPYRDYWYGSEIYIGTIDPQQSD